MVSRVLFSPAAQGLNPMEYSIEKNSITLLGVLIPKYQPLSMGLPYPFIRNQSNSEDSRKYYGLGNLVFPEL